MTPIRLNLTGRTHSVHRNTKRFNPAEAVPPSLPSTSRPLVRMPDPLLSGRSFAVLDVGAARWSETDHSFGSVNTSRLMMALQNVFQGMPAR